MNRSNIYIELKRVFFFFRSQETTNELSILFDRLVCLPAAKPHLYHLKVNFYVFFTENYTNHEWIHTPKFERALTLLMNYY